MTAIVILLLITVLLFGFVVFFGAPYLPTFSKQTEVALDMLDLKPGQTLLELGCGDGRVLLAAAKRDINAIGFELNPFLVAVSRIRTWRYRKTVKVRWANFWQAQWPSAEGIYVFLLDKYMLKLDKNIIQKMPKPVRLVSFAFAVPGKSALAEKQGIHLYEYV